MQSAEDRVGATGAVAPTAAAHVALRPLAPSGVELGDGLLGERQRLNADVTLHHGWVSLERVGTIDNFRIAAGRLDGERRGYVFSDSDVYKWLEGVAWELGRRPSQELRQYADIAIELIAAAQQDDGYINTWCQINDLAWRWTDLEMGHELYCAGHLIQAAVAWARALGDERLLEIARRFADLIDTVFTGGELNSTDGHPEVETALVELYRETGERRYLELANILTTRRGSGQFHERFPAEYYQDSEPVRESRRIHGHAVRAAYLAAGVTDIYAETGEEQLLRATLAQWEDMASSKTYLTGGIGSRHTGEAFGEPYELPPDRAYCETCAAIASVMWSWRLLLVTGESRFADLIERTLYNGFLSGLALDGRTFFYMNPLQTPPTYPRRHDWHPVACCPPNIMRMLASIQQYVATRDHQGLQLHQYTSGVISAATPDGEPLGVRVVTRYPWEGRVAIEILTPGEWTLALRIPDWAMGATVDGQQAQPGDYTRLRRAWQDGDKVVLDLNVSPRLTVPNPRIDAVRGCVAIERGPLVYCVEQVDVGADVDLADLRVDPSSALADGSELTALYGATAVICEAEVAGVDGWHQHGYRDARDLGDGALPDAGQAARQLELTAVPYFTWANRGPGGMRVWLPRAD